MASPWRMGQRMLGLHHADGNILFGASGECRAMYRLGTVSYEFLTDRGKRDVVLALMVALMEAKAEVSLMRVCRHYPADRYVRQAMRLLDAEHADERLWRWHLECHAVMLTHQHPQESEVYMIAQLPERSAAGALIDEARRTLWRVSRAVEGAAGVAAAAPVPQDEMRRIRDDETRLYGALREALYSIGVERATTQELQWLLARGRCRGVGEPELDEFWRPRALTVEGDGGAPAYRPITTLVDRAAKARIDQHDRHLEVMSEHGRSYQCALVLGSLPERPPWPGPQCELMFAPLEQLPFPVDATLHLGYTPNEQAQRQARTKTLEADVTAREEHHSVLGGTWASQETRSVARELQEYLTRQDGPPMLSGALQLIVGAPSLKELEHKVDQIKHVYRPITVHRPLGVQRRLFYEHMPSAVGSRVHDWDDPLTIEQVGAMVPIAVNSVGSPAGAHLGSTPIKARPVKFDVTEAAREAAGSAVLLAGGLGSGKTVAAQSIAVTALLRGSQVVDIDPKPDHGLHRYEPIKQLVHRFSLTGEEKNRGALDPLRVPLPEVREEAAMSYYSELIGPSLIAGQGMRPALQRAIRECMHAGEWGSLAVIRRLQAAGTAAQALAEEMQVYADFGLARLAFGDPASDEVEARARLTSIVTPALDLPDGTASREQYTPRERISVATLGLLADMALRLVSGDPARNKVILFDEAWFLLSSTQGRALFSRLVRMGRAQNAVIVIATQRLADVGDLENLVGTFLIFGQPTEQEARGALTLLGLPDADEMMVSRVQSHKRGRCLMRDIHGQIAEVQVEMEPGLLTALNTSVAGPPVAATELSG